MLGLERGIQRAFRSLQWPEFRVAAHVEIEAFVVENLVRQMEQGVLAPAPVWSNLKTFPSQQFHGKIHGITGGYPCQPFSVAGNRKGTEDPRHLWPYIKTMVGAIRPVWCFFENVPGHLTLGYREVRSDLERLGYKVEEGIFSAEEVGAPHQRKRLFILALDNAYRERFKQEYEIQAGRNAIEFASEELENAFSGRSKWQRRIQGLGKDEETLGETSEITLRTSQRIELANTQHNGYAASEIGGSPETRNGGCETGQKDGEQLEGCCKCGVGLADPTKQRVEGNWTKGKQESEIPTGEAILRCNRGRDSWPARPGEQQYEWEEPRVESRLGFTVNGYNYREDLLRMAGNGVVEQTAELAFKTLLNKHLC